MLAVVKGHQMSVIATYVYVSRDGGGDGSSDAYTMSFADALRFRSGSDDLIVVDATVGAADLNALDASTDGTVVTEPYVTMVTGSSTRPCLVFRETTFVKRWLDSTH